MVEHALDAGGAVESGAETETPRPELRARRHSRFLGRRWSRADKWRIVEESYQPGTSVSLVARRYDVNANQVFNWRREARDGRLGKPPVGNPRRDGVHPARGDRRRQRDSFDNLRARDGCSCEPAGAGACG